MGCGVWQACKYMVLYTNNPHLYIEKIMNNFTGLKPFHPHTKHVHALICSTPSPSRANRKLFGEAHRINDEDDTQITISVEGVDEFVDAKTLKLMRNEEELSFVRVINITRSSDIALEGTGIVSLDEAKVIGHSSVQRVVVERAQMLADGFPFTFSAIGHIVGPNREVTPSTRFSIEGNYAGKRALISLPPATCNEILLLVINKHSDIVDALKPAIREFILESIHKVFPHKQGYLNDMEIRTLATKLKGAEPVKNFDKYDLIAFIQIVVNNYDYYKRLYNSCRIEKSHL